MKELEEIAEKLYPVNSTGGCMGMLSRHQLNNSLKQEGFISGAMWQQERMYSEEEVKELAFNFYYDMSRQMNVPENLVSENRTNMDIWFEQNKKK